ncbi:MAG TPA: ABC transporter permease [Phycisphaerae bacterium]|nr:ABC transporter permease [Phycisphaerae bacterium]
MSPPPPAARRTRPPAGGRVFGALNVLGVYGLVGGLFALGCAISREFISPDNLMNALRAVTLLGIVAVGLAFVTYSRHYVDLSIPGIMALSGTVAVWALKFGFVPSLAIGLAVGALVGLVNGLVIGYLRLNPIIWTLAMMSLLSGVIRWAYAGRQIYPDKATAAGRAFLELYHHRLLGLLPLPVAVLLAVAAGGYFLMRHTGYGARLKLTGSAYEVARLTGINVRRAVAGAFVISSLTSAAAGVLLTSFNKVGAVYIGGGYDFRTITAVVLGGMTLAGGRGSIVGVLGGVAAIALMNNVMSLVRVGQFVLGDFQQNIVQGAVFILVVGINSFARRRTGGDDA